MTKLQFKTAFNMAVNQKIELPSYYSIEVCDAIDTKKFLTLKQLACIIRAECISLYGQLLGHELDNTFNALKKYYILEGV